MCLLWAIYMFLRGQALFESLGSVWNLEVVQGLGEVAVYSKTPLVVSGDWDLWGRDSGVVFKYPWKFSGVSLTCLLKEAVGGPPGVK